MSTVAVLDPAQQPSPGAVDRLNPLIGWLLGEGWTLSRPSDLVAQLGLRMNAAGIPVYRLRINIRTLHPQYVDRKSVV